MMPGWCMACSSWLAVFDSDSPNAIGYSVSADGVNWEAERVLVVQSENARWAGDNGLREVRTPLGLLSQGDGTYILLYTARIKSVKPAFYAVGKCVVQLTLAEK